MTVLQGEVLHMRDVNTSKMIPVFRQCKKTHYAGRGGGISKRQKFFPGFSQSLILKLKQSCTFIFKILTLTDVSGR